MEGESGLVPSERRAGLVSWLAPAYVETAAFSAATSLANGRSLRKYLKCDGKRNTIRAVRFVRKHLGLRNSTEIARDVQ